jgi:uncharacterized protein YwgA
MERYQLAKLVEWAGTLRTRKRMQKLVYLLQAAGCPLNARFVLHHFGPYSFEVAKLSDEMHAAELFEESEEDNYVGRAFNYGLSPKGRNWVREMEAGAAGKKRAKDISTWKERVDELLKLDVRVLEVAATILAFKRESKDWDQALDKACRFKKLDPKDALAKTALELARKTV